MPNLCAKYIVGAALSYALFLVYKCPCERLVACHSFPYWMSLGVAALAIPANNYLIRLSE